MSNLNVAMLCPPGYSKEIAKPGTASDITFYNLKSGDVTVTMVEPSRYPEKLAPLFFTVSIAEKVVLVIDEINAQLGEIILMLDCADRKNGLLIMRNYITPEQVAPLLKGTVIEGYEIIDDDRMRLRERLLAEAGLKSKDPSLQAQTPGAMPIDHFFNVKGSAPWHLGA